MSSPRTGPHTTTKRRLARLASCCVAAALMWACGPVYIPVPPPAAATQTAFTAVPDAAGNPPSAWIAEGQPHAPANNGTYYLFDQERNSGVIAGAAADGSYRSPPMSGTAGDRVLVRYTDAAGDDSAVACLILGEERPFALPCPP